MKIEVKLDKNEHSENALPKDPPLEHGSKDEASIDIAQVLAANQALMKNLLLKMENMEHKLHAIEGAYKRQLRLARTSAEQRKLLLEAPKTIKAWEPEYPRLDDRYFSGFNFLTSFFFPEKMRRRGAEKG